MAKKIGKYNDGRIAILCDALATGCPRKTACSIAGIGESTFYEWLKEKPEFVEEIEKAESQACFEALDALKSAFGHDWRAAAWFLARKGGPDFIEQQKIDHTTNGKEIVTFTLDFGRKLEEEITEE